MTYTRCVKYCLHCLLINWFKLRLINLSNSLQVSSLLKLYCREMPDPLCTYDLYDGFLRAAKVPEEFRLGAMREMVMALPKEHFR